MLPVYLFKTPSNPKTLRLLHIPAVNDQETGEANKGQNDGEER